MSFLRGYTPKQIQEITINPLSANGEAIANLWTAVEHSLADDPDPTDSDVTLREYAGAAFRAWFLSAHDHRHSHVRFEWEVGDEVVRSGIRCAFKWACHARYTPRPDGPPVVLEDGAEWTAEHSWLDFEYHVANAFAHTCNLYGQLVGKATMDAEDLAACRRHIEGFRNAASSDEDEKAVLESRIAELAAQLADVTPTAKVWDHLGEPLVLDLTVPHDGGATRLYGALSSTVEKYVCGCRDAAETAAILSTHDPRVLVSARFLVSVASILDQQHRAAEAVEVELDLNANGGHAPHVDRIRRANRGLPQKRR